MTQPLPPAPAPPKKKSNGLLYGCAIGCAAFAALGIVAVVVVMVFVVPRIKAGMEEARGEMVAALVKEYDAAKEKGEYTPDQLAVLDDIVAVAQGDNASFFATSIVVAAVVSFVHDGTMSETEMTSATDLRDFLQANPDASVVEMGTFIQNHPSLQQIFEEAQHNVPDLTPPSATPEEN